MLKIKRISIAPGEELSLQYHRLRDEHWCCTAGTGLWSIGVGFCRISAGARAFIPAGVVHRICNDGDRLMTVLEIQIGPVNIEQDIVRLYDRYGR